MNIKRSFLICLAALCWLLPAAPGAQAAGLDRESDTDGFDPAAESFRINEARRQNEISRQLELNYRMIWEHGFNPASPPVRQPIGHEWRPLGPNKSLSRPLYLEDVAPEPILEEGPELLPDPRAGVQPPAAAQPAPQTRPAQIQPRQLPAPADAKPGDRVDPARQKPRTVRGPREF